MLTNWNCFWKIPTWWWRTVGFMFVISARNEDAVKFIFYDANAHHFQFGFRAWINFKLHMKLIWRFIWLHWNQMHRSPVIKYWWKPASSSACVDAVDGQTFVCSSFANSLQSELYFEKFQFISIFRVPPITGYYYFGKSENFNPTSSTRNYGEIHC